MRALPLALAAAAATSFLELLPEPSMVCDNSKCRLEGEEPCLREYAIDRDCSTFGDAYLVLDDALAACARHENCSGVYDPRCDGMPAENCPVNASGTYCWAHGSREPIWPGLLPDAQLSHDHDWYPFACCPADRRRFFCATRTGLRTIPRRTSTTRGGASSPAPPGTSRTARRRPTSARSPTADVRRPFDSTR